MLYPLVLDKQGRKGPDFLRSEGMVICMASTEESESGDGIDTEDESAGVGSGVGDCSCRSIATKGTLCGRGEKSISIKSWAPGEDEGMGGVVT